MDIDLLSNMIGELLIENNEVTLPGVGTFVAEIVGASFSDRGFTINPPYRKLSFRQREGNPDLLIDFYARTNGLPVEEARKILVDFLTEMKEVLKQRKVIIFPGLGRLRATRENHFFFVPDESLNIDPEGFGLESVSLKFHDEELAELPQTVSAVSDIVEGPVQANADPQSPAPSVSPSEAPQSPVPSVSPSEAPQNSATSEDCDPAVIPAEEPQAAEFEVKVPSESAAEGPKKRKSPLVTILIAVIILSALFFAAVYILGHYAPQLIDPLLYSPEELTIINNV